MTPCSHDHRVRGCAQCGQLATALATLPVHLGDAFATQRTRHRLLASFASPAPRSRWRLGLGLAAAVAVIAIVAWPRSVDPQVAADTVTVAPTTARWSRHDEPGSTLIRLDDGALDLHVGHELLAHRLVVSLPDGELDDIGTTFRVTVAGGRTTAVSVREGAVVVRLVDRAPIFLVGGESWSATPSPPIVVRTPAPEPTPTARPPEPPRKPAPRSLPVQAEAPPVPRAATAYRDAARLFDRGELAAAIDALRAFLAAHPDDTHAEDASYLLVLALQRHRETAAAGDAARSYLARYPHGFRRAEVEGIAR